MFWKCTHIFLDFGGVKPLSFEESENAVINLWIRENGLPYLVDNSKRWSLKKTAWLCGIMEHRLKKIVQSSLIVGLEDQRGCYWLHPRDAIALVKEFKIKELNRVLKNKKRV